VEHVGFEIETIIGNNYPGTCRIPIEIKTMSETIIGSNQRY
jgi:hypothetical protein